MNKFGDVLLLVLVALMFVFVIWIVADVGAALMQDKQCQVDAALFDLEYKFYSRQCYFVLSPGYLVERQTYLTMLVTYLTPK